VQKKQQSLYAPQPYTNQSVFKSLLNCTSEISLLRNATGVVTGTTRVHANDQILLLSFNLTLTRSFIHHRSLKSGWTRHWHAI